MSAIGQKIMAVIADFFTPTVLSIWVMTSVVAAFAGPFGTFDSQSFVWRLVYWSSVIGASIPIAIAARVFWTEILGESSLWIQDVLVAATMTFTFGSLLAFVNVLLVGMVNHQTVDWRLALCATFLISMTAIIVGNVVRASIEQNVATPATQKRDRLLARLDVAQGIRLVKVSSDNHHVRILTSDGTEHRLLMRLRDAVVEIDFEIGCCVHRSHWVARNEIERVTFIDGKEVVVMRGGQTVPVGPKYRPRLIEAGAIAA